ncbi:MAG: DUF1080 domain-containing protein [Opitutales bacterium]|jgi:hypothetical protein|nr:DUF1080 domain-containing protein [Opitutales bacterium]MDB2499557.1 DUF1080 domain-containing protein [bacterium]MDG2169250.1 DUF1080 domain-containing protein [Opitutales bacterium]
MIQRNHTIISSIRLLAIGIFAWVLAPIVLQAESVPKGLIGDWTLYLTSDEPAWMKVEEVDGEPVVQMRVHVQSAGPHKITKFENGRITFDMKIKRELGGGGAQTKVNTVTVGLKNGKLDGVITGEWDDEKYNRITFTGKKYPPMPAKPDLSKVRFGQPKTLFNGKDLTGWEIDNPEKKNGWRAEDGMLVNVTPKTDFGSTGSYGNIQTEENFEDFWLHIEFLIEANRNSGVYLRGMYEAQVVDRDSRMQGLQGVGAIFSRIAPSVNAGRLPGEWQTYDLTLVDRHVTVVLNGFTVIDNQPIDGPTGGAINTDPTMPGPIHLQGDHTSVKYRDIYLAPVIKD